ncbi:hypothetical protein BU599_12615, partial [Staphylococcus arlettae]|uniref:hypothetical protein n=1 Tax=Staphylococcus arlettae TaxID=29378 RepID=UPI000D4C2589
GVLRTEVEYEDLVGMDIGHERLAGRLESSVVVIPAQAGGALQQLQAGHPVTARSARRGCIPEVPGPVGQALFGIATGFRLAPE